MAEKPTYEELEHRIQELEAAESEQKRTEEALRLSEAVFRGLIESSSDWIWEVNAEGVYTYSSPKVEDILGYKPEEIVGKTPFDMMPPEETERIAGIFKDAVRKGESIIALENVCLHKDGRRIALETSGVPIFDEAGKISGYRGVDRDITDRMQAEEALRESEARFKGIFENTKDGVAVYQAVNGGKDFIIVDFNKGAEKIENVKREDLIGNSVLEVFPGVKNFGLFDVFQRVWKTGNPEHHPITLYKDQRTKGWRDNFVYKLPSGEIATVYSDETKNKQAEEALRESEKRLLSVFRAAPTGIGVVIDRVLKQVNERICEMTGYSKEELTGQNARIFYPSDEDYEYVGREKYRQITGLGTGSVETRWKHKDGRIIDVLLSSTPMDLNDLSKGVTFTALDITERKKAREALRTSHERFLTVLDSIDATIYVADMETHEILFMNKNMIESFGKDMTGEICWDGFRRKSEPCRDCTNDQLIDEHGKPADVCIWHGKNPVTGKWYINHDRAITWTDGHLVKLQIATDITDLRVMEQQVQQTQKFEAIGTLAGGIAHDFNNLLMGIQGRASLISTDLETAHSHLEHIKAIEGYIQSATDLTKQLLGLARGGKYEVRPIDINDLISNSANMFGRTKKEIRIHNNFRDPPPVVTVDQNQIEQVLLNLFINAWQAMPGGGELYLETQIVTLDDAFCTPYGAKPGQYVKVSVADTGSGIDESIHHRVFDPFFTTKEKGRGTGLGLASAYGIIKNHDGIITVYSEVGHGTTFNIYLPLSDKEAYREVPMEGQLLKGSETVLLVDDEEMILEVGQAMLEKLGYRVVVAVGGKQAVDMVKRKGNEIDLVLLDLIMPGMDGGKVFDRIKQIRPLIPVVLSSGYAINGQAGEIMQRGCNGFIQKPFNISELSQKIRKILDKVKIS